MAIETTPTTETPFAAPPNNLDTFRILFLVYGILCSLGCLVLTAYFFVVTIFSNIVETQNTEFQEMGFNPMIIFQVFLGIGIIFTLTTAILSILSSVHISRKTNYNLIFTTAIITCFTGILGILLCIFTLIELTKPHVKKVFNKE